MHRLFLITSLCFLLRPAALLAQRESTILDHRDRIRITRMDVLNSPHRETNLSITPDGKIIYFMSLRGGQEWSWSYMTYRGDSVFDGDIWYSQKTGTAWARPKCMPYGINTRQGEDEPTVSPDGRTVYYQSWNEFWQFTGGPYYKASREGSSWGRPQGLGGGITEFFKLIHATDGMSISPDEKRFIVAAGPEYDQPMDLYMSKKSDYGWSYCQKLGISTPGDERSAFIAADGKTLYFASDGYRGFGGLDIFKTTLNPDGSFGEVINIGAPFNTPADDYGFILTADGNEAYFIRNGDIYFADLTEADVRIKPTTATVAHTLTGTVKDSASLKGLTAQITLLDARTKLVIDKTTTNTAGKYSIQLPNQARIIDQVVTVDGYPSKRRRLTIEAKSYSQTYPSNFLMGKPAEPPVLAPPIATVPPPAPQPAPLPVQPAPQPIGPTRSDPVPVKPAPVPVKPVDPYSFEGIARNNLVLLLDVSASMNKPEKLQLLKQSFTRMLTHMRGEDLISIIIYSGDAAVVLDGVSAANKQAITRALDNLRSSGSTNGKNALRRAYALAQENLIPAGNNRIILATDGYFEVEELYGIAQKSSNQQIKLSVLAYGKLPKEKIAELEQLARYGGGNFANVTPENADEALLKEAKAVRN